VVIAYGRRPSGIDEPVLGSILTHQYRFATRTISLTLRGAQQALGLASGIVDEVVDRLGVRNGHDQGDVVTGEVVPEPERRAEPAPDAPAKPHGDPLTRSPAASPTSSTPATPDAPATPAEPATPDRQATSAAPAVTSIEAEPPAASIEAEPPAAEPAHVSAEAEVVEELADPGAEDGAGAQVRVVGEPWPGYRHLKARDVIARLASATREELAAVELFELAHANRKSVVTAAQQALKQASPPRGGTGQ
jgi:hypothetical protein